MLGVLDRRIRAGERISEEVQLAVFAMPILWEGVLGFGRRKKPVYRQWQASFEELFEKLVGPIRLWAQQRHRLWALVQTYWRLHQQAESETLVRKLKRAERLPEALLVLELECEAHGIPMTRPWLKLQAQQKDVAREDISR